MTKKKKHALEDEAWMWLQSPFMPGLQSIHTSNFNQTTKSYPRYHRYTNQPFEVDPYRLRQLFNIPAYVAYATILPTPLEQIAFSKDPLGIVPPYEWRGSFHAILDLSATVTDPIGVARSKLVNPFATTPVRNNSWLIEAQLAAGYVEGDYWGAPSG